MKLRAAYALSLLSTLLLGPVAVPAAAQTEDVVKRYEKLEKSAPPEAQSDLKTLRDQISAQSLGFRVGYTQAMRYPLAKITGMRKPADLLERIRAQNARARERLRTAPAMRAAAVCDGTEPSFDWRVKFRVTKVRDQGPCGSCWAFGTHAAFESSYKTVHLDDKDLDTAEQETLDCNDQGWDCEGGWWAYDYLIGKGAAREQDYPYTAAKGACRTGVANPFAAVAWGYVGDDTSVPSEADLKKALCEHGPLGVALYASPAFQSYAGGVFDLCVSSDDVNHAVTLIGWDDSRRAWLIKNSWGTNWGETGDTCSGCNCPNTGGYGWVRYGCNNIGYAASWVLAR
jgi:cathepsin L